MNQDRADWHTLQGKGLQSETEAILPEVSADGCRTHGKLRERRRVGSGTGGNSALSPQVAGQTRFGGAWRRIESPEHARSLLPQTSSPAQATAGGKDAKNQLHMVFGEFGRSPVQSRSSAPVFCRSSGSCRQQFPPNVKAIRGKRRLFPSLREQRNDAA